MPNINKYDLLERILGDLLIENKSLTAQQAYRIIEITISRDMSADENTFQKELIDAAITSEDLITKLLPGKLAGVDILRQHKVETRRAIQMISHFSFVQINQLDSNFATWISRLMIITQPRMIDHIPAKTVRAGLINILNGEPSSMVFNEAEHLQIKELKTSILQSVNGMNPVELIQIIFDDEFIKACDRKSIETLENTADSNIISTFIEASRTMATPVTSNSNQIVIDNLNIVYQKEFAGKNYSPVEPVSCPPAPVSPTVNFIPRTLRSTNSSYDDSSVQLMAIAAGTALGLTVVLPMFNLVRRQFGSFFFKNPPTLPLAKDELNLLPTNKFQAP